MTSSVIATTQRSIQNIYPAKVVTIVVSHTSGIDSLRTWTMWFPCRGRRLREYWPHATSQNPQLKRTQSPLSIDETLWNRKENINKNKAVNLIEAMDIDNLVTSLEEDTDLVPIISSKKSAPPLPNRCRVKARENILLGFHSIGGRIAHIDSLRFLFFENLLAWQCISGSTWPEKDIISPQAVLEFIITFIAHHFYMQTSIY